MIRHCCSQERCLTKKYWYNRLLFFLASMAHCAIDEIFSQTVATEKWWVDLSLAANSHQKLSSLYNLCDLGTSLQLPVLFKDGIQPW